MNDYTHLLLHEARTRLAAARVDATSSQRRAARRTRMGRRLLRALSGGRSGTRDGEGSDQLPVAVPDRRAASA